MEARSEASVAVDWMQVLQSPRAWVQVDTMPGRRERVWGPGRERDT